MFELAPYYEVLFSVATISIFMAISPGADFAMITRNSLMYSRTAGLYSAVGVSMAIWIHVAYSIAGLAVIISNSILLFSIIKYIGAAYLIYIGWQTFKADPQAAAETSTEGKSLSNFQALKIGFVTNALNPKTTVFMLSIFTQIVTPQTPIAMQVIYGAIISAAHLLWFCTVALLLTHPAVLARFNRYRNYIEKAVGGILIAFGLKVATATTE